MNGPHLVLLDLMLPGTDGIELMKEMLETADVPVIFLSVYGPGGSHREGVRHGGRGLHGQALLADGACRANQGGAAQTGDGLGAVGAVCASGRTDASTTAERRVTLAGRLVELMALEYRVLVELSANAGRIVTQEQLLQRVWGERSGGDVRPMRTVVSRLRRKLGDDANQPAYIFTEPRVGYRMPKGETAEPEEP